MCDCIHVIYQNSWQQFLYTRCQNINRLNISSRQQAAATSSPKRCKVEPDKHVYAALDFECDNDEVSIKRNVDLLKKEASKPKSKSSSVRELIKRTLKPRRDKIVTGGCRPYEIFTEFPHLKKSAYVSCLHYNYSLHYFYCDWHVFTQISYEFELIVNLENSFDAFDENWEEWKKPIIQYAQAYSNIPKHLRLILQELVPNNTGTSLYRNSLCIFMYFYLQKARLWLLFDAYPTF